MNICKSYSGLIFALLAALSNATIGIFSVKLINNGLAPFAIAFYRCLLAFILTMVWLITSGRLTSSLNYFKKYYVKLAICAIFGFFILHFFETNAYHYNKVPVVVFLLLGSATGTTFILSAIIKKKMLLRIEMLSLVLAIIGLGLIFDIGKHSMCNIYGVSLALIAGAGYGTFLTISAKFKIGSGLHVISGLLLFGTIYLFIPFIYYGGGSIGSWNSLLLLLCLAFIPTIGGFWFTVKALTLIESETVQLLELSEPLISILFAFIFLQQVLHTQQLIGGLFIVLAIYINMHVKN